MSCSDVRQLFWGNIRFKIGVGILFHEREHLFSVGAWPRPSSPAPTPAQTQESVMATDTWLDGTADWNTPSDWSAGLPDASSDVVINQGNPQVTASFGTVNSIANSAALDFIDAGASSVTGNVTLGPDGSLLLDIGPGKGGSTLTVGGWLGNYNGRIQIGDAENTLSAPSTIEAGKLVNVRYSDTPAPSIFSARRGRKRPSTSTPPRASARPARSPEASAFPATRSWNSRAARSRPSRPMASCFWSVPTHSSPTRRTQARIARSEASTP
jgi:hypothetical protein